MMEAILLFAAKSFVVAGGALLLLQLMRKRSAADRSWIAHLALVALLLVLVAAFTLPSLEVQGPAFLAGDGKGAGAQLPASQAELRNPGEVKLPGSASFPATAAGQSPTEAGGAINWFLWGYLLAAAVLLLLTLIALGRLFLLKSRATVLVEPEWLTALAHAQRRMGFKHGTALLTSDELPSPISWGVVRPVILLNSQAAKSYEQAEAIITHELAHVARLDWAKLLVSRLAVAIFWFNPLVWMLAREAHQLREEAADDAVLAAGIEETAYAKLLVAVARRECRGLLIGAHGVAPSRNSLSRRIKRVLDTATTRAPGGWRWASAAGFFAAGMAVPVAALNLVAPPLAASTKTSAPPLLNMSDPTAETAAATLESLPMVTPETAMPVAAAATGIAEAAHPHQNDEEVRRLKAELEQARRQGWNGDGPLPGTIEPRPGTVGPLPGTTGPRVETVGPSRSNGSAVALRGGFDAVSVTGGGDVLVRYGRTHHVRILRGHGPGALVSTSNGALSVNCQRECRGLLVEVTTPHVEALAINGGGSIDITGDFPVTADLALAIRGGGRIDARQLPARTVAAATHGGGTILTSARDEIAATTTGGGNIRYWGNATVASAIQGGGRIEPGGT